MANSDPNVMTSTMFSFVRRHWYVSIKVVALFVVLYLLTLSFGFGNWIYIVISIITALAFVFFDYNDIWGRGMRDFNLVKYEYIKYNKLKGLISGLLAQIPGLILILLILITQNSAASTYSDVFKLAYFVLYSPFITFITGYLGITSLAYFLPLLIIPIVSTIAYYLGYRNIGIVQRVIYQRKTDRSKNKKLR